MKESVNFSYYRSNNAIFQHFLPSQSDAIQSGKRQIFTRKMHFWHLKPSWLAEVCHQAFRGAVMVEHQVILGEFIQNCYTKFVAPKKRMKGKKTYPSFCNLILQTWLVKLISKSLKMIREITGNPETFSPFPSTSEKGKLDGVKVYADLQVGFRSRRSFLSGHRDVHGSW